MKGFIALFTALCLAGAPSAQAQVSRCIDDRLRSTVDDLMQRATDRLQTVNPEATFLNDPLPCIHARHMSRALARTTGIDPWPALIGYEYFKVVRGRAHFTAERLIFRDRQPLQRMASALDKLRSRKLSIKENTVYETFLVDDSLFIIVTAAAERQESAAMRAQVRQQLGG